MRALRLSPRARADLDDIWEYSTRNWGPDRAEAYLGEINRAFELLRRTPEIAAPCDHVRLGLRRFPTGSHVLYCRVSPDRLEVVRVLHGGMDVNAQF